MPHCFTRPARRRLIKLTAGRDIYWLQLHRMQCWSSWHVKTKSYVRLTISIYHYCVINRYLGMSCKMTRQTLRRYQLSYHLLPPNWNGAGVGWHLQISFIFFLSKTDVLGSRIRTALLMARALDIYIFMDTWPLQDEQWSRNPKIYGFYFDRSCNLLGAPNDTKRYS